MSGAPPKNWENVAAASAIGIFSGIGFSAYIVIVVVQLRYSKMATKNSYYKLWLSLAISDCTMLVLAFYSIPCTLLQRPVLGDNFDVAMGVCSNIAYFAGLVCVSLIAINRYWGVCRYFSYALVFNKFKTKVLLCFIWVFGFTSGLFQSFPCCHLRYFPSDYTWGYDMDCWGNAYFPWYDRSCTIVTFLTIVFCYSNIIWKRPGAVGNANNANQLENLGNDKILERKLALQFGIVASFLIAFGMSFTIIPILTDNRWCMFITNIIGLINYGCNPFVYLAFNSEIRENVKKFLRRNRSNEENTVLHLQSSNQPISADIRIVRSSVASNPYAIID